MQHKEEVLPAQAGVILDARYILPRCLGAPRTGGGDPLTSQLSNNAK